jgi:site-specific recombinase XerC
VEHGAIPRDIAGVKLMLNTGVRISELCALLWKDVRIGERQGLLTVRKGKGGKRRQIPLKRMRERLCCCWAIENMPVKHCRFLWANVAP